MPCEYPAARSRRGSRTLVARFLRVPTSSTRPLPCILRLRQSQSCKIMTWDIPMIHRISSFGCLPAKPHHAAKATKKQQQRDATQSQPSRRLVDATTEPSWPSAEAPKNQRKVGERRPLALFLVFAICWHSGGGDPALISVRHWLAVQRPQVSL
jgi:hypothetical protein